MKILDISKNLENIVSLNDLSDLANPLKNEFAISKSKDLEKVISDMETEGKVLKAINEVKSFDVLSGGGIGLYDANGALVIVLEK